VIVATTTMATVVATTLIASAITTVINHHHLCHRDLRCHHCHHHYHHLPPLPLSITPRPTTKTVIVGGGGDNNDDNHDGGGADSRGDDDGLIINNGDLIGCDLFGESFRDIIVIFGSVWGSCKFLVSGFQMQFLKQNVFGKNWVEMVFKSFSKHFNTHFQNQEKMLCGFGF